MLRTKNRLAGSILGIVGVVIGVTTASGSAPPEPRGFVIAAARSTCFEEAVLDVHMKVVEARLDGQGDALDALVDAAKATDRPSDALLLEIGAQMAALWATRQEAQALIDLILRRSRDGVVPKDCDPERMPHIS